MKDNEYQCAKCKEVFTEAWTEEEALAEKKKNGWENISCDIVCDDCYKKAMMRFN